MLGCRLVWPKATVFEIVITGSNPVTSAKQFILCSSIGLGQWPFKSQRRVRFPYRVPTIHGALSRLRSVKS
jgi:hypothetical protein